MLRWGIKTSFRDLKYAIGLVYFHAKKLNSVLQEVHAALLVLNFVHWLSDALHFFIFVCNAEIPSLQNTRGKAHCVSGGMRAALMVDNVSVICYN